MALKFKFIGFEPDKTTMKVENTGVLRDTDAFATQKHKSEFDLPRHADFERAFDRMKPHLLISGGFVEPTDVLGNFLQASHFNDFFSDSELEQQRFGEIELKSIELKGKNGDEFLVLKGIKIAPNGEEIPVVSPQISLVGTDGYSYPLLSILDTQWEKLLFEAEQYYLEKKHGAGRQLSTGLETQTPYTNTKKKSLASAE